jgi:glycopeptide antibiotics resistance protein
MVPREWGEPVREFGPATIVAALLAVLAVALAARSVRREPATRRQTTVAWVAVVFAALALAAFTLVPGHGRRTTNFVPLHSILRELHSANAVVVFLNIAGNVLVMMPLGIALVLATRWSVRTLTAIGLAVSVVIEALQWTVVAGRATDIDDVLLNTAGMALGALLGVAVLGARRSAGRDRRPVRTSPETPKAPEGASGLL